MKWVILGFIMVLFSCNETKLNEKRQHSIAAIGNEYIAVYDPDERLVKLLTKSGVLVKTVNLDKVDSVQSFKVFKSQIHNWNDSLQFSGEWIGDKLYWKVRTSKTNTRGASNLRLDGESGISLVYLCTTCRWGPVGTGGIDYYEVEGVVENVPIDIWNKVNWLSFRAVDR